MNYWLNLSVARRIAAQLQIKYCGQPAAIEDAMLDDLWDHPEYTEEMWLNVHLDDFDCICWVQIGTENDLVPR